MLWHQDGVIPLWCPWPLNKSNNNSSNNVWILTELSAGKPGCAPRMVGEAGGRSVPVSWENGDEVLLFPLSWGSHWLPDPSRTLVTSLRWAGIKDPGDKYGKGEEIL